MDEFIFHVAACSDTPQGGIYSLRVADAAVYPVALSPLAEVNYLLQSPDGLMRATTKNGLATLSPRHDGGFDIIDIFAPAGGGCHLALSPTQRFVFTANYHDGELLVTELANMLPISTRRIAHSGTLGPHRERQEMAHPHCTVISPDKCLLAVADLGLDAIFLYRLSPDTGIEKSPAQMINLPPGCGPRHIVFTADNDIWVVGELDNQLYHYRAKAGNYILEKRASTLPCSDNNIESYAAALKLSPDGRYIAASNRGHNSVAVLDLDKLTIASHTSTEGAWPRDFAFLPNGFAAAANEHSGTVSLFYYKNNRLISTGEVAHNMPGAMCIVT